MNQILIPIDFTERSKSVLTHVFNMFKPDRNRLIFFHSYMESTIVDVLISVDDIIESDLKKDKQAALDALILDYINEPWDIDFHIMRGPLLKAIRKFQMQTEIDMIVFGISDGLSWDVTGDQIASSEIVDCAEFPVLVIPEKSEIQAH